MTLYFISGLGVDRRAFQKINLPTSIRIIYLDWIKPTKYESLSEYALRLGKAINTSEPFSLVGLSFGGMIASEIAITIPPKHLIIISSASTYCEIPKIYRVFGMLGIHKITPASLFKIITPFTFWLFNANTKKEKAFLSTIIQDTEPAFLKWAISAILKWRNKIRPLQLYHIHGTRDNILPLRCVNADVSIPGAGHFLVFSHGGIVSKLLMERLGYS